MLIFCALWLNGELIYYGIKDLSGNIFYNSLVVFSAEIIAYLGSGYFANTVGSKFTIILGFDLISVFGVVYVLLI